MRHLSVDSQNGACGITNAIANKMFQNIQNKFRNKKHFASCEFAQAPRLCERACMKRKQLEDFTVKRMLDWIGGDPHKEADLILEAPIAASTLLAVKRGGHIPSKRLARSIMSAIERLSS